MNCNSSNSLDCNVCGRGIGGIRDPRMCAVICDYCNKLACRNTCILEMVDDEMRPIFMCMVCGDHRKEHRNTVAWLHNDDTTDSTGAGGGFPNHHHQQHRSSYAGPSSATTNVVAARMKNERAHMSVATASSASAEPMMTSELEPDSEEEEDDDYVPPKPRWASSNANCPEKRQSMMLRHHRRSVSVTHYYSSDEDDAGEPHEEAPEEWVSEDEQEYRDNAPDERQHLGNDVVDDEHDEEESEQEQELEQEDGTPSKPQTLALSLNPTGVVGAGNGTGTETETETGKKQQKQEQEVTATTTSPRPLEPPAPEFIQPPIHEDSAGQLSAVAVSRRASLAAVERLMEKMTAEEEEKTAKSNGGNGIIQHSAPHDLPSSPDDDQTCLGQLEFSVIYDSQAQTLTVTIMKASNLRSRDKNGYSDPYVKLHLFPGAAKSTKLRTRTIAKTLHPEWNENLVYYGIGEDERQKKTLRLLVLDEDRIGADFLGETRVPLKRLVAGKEKLFNVYLESQLPLEKTAVQTEGRGKILLSLCYNQEKTSLLIEVVRCSELLGMDPNGYSDPYVKMTLVPEESKKHRAKTKTKKKTLNPVFDEQFSFPISLAELAKKTLEITVWDKDVAKHDDYLGGFQLGSHLKGDRSKHWNDCVHNPDTKFQLWHKLTDEQFVHSNSSSM